MIVRAKEPPEYTDQFLKKCSDSFKRRGKALRYRGRITFSYDPQDSFEWLTILYRASNSPAIMLQLVEGGKVSLYLRSTGSRDRGKVLLRLEGMRTVINPDVMLSVFEWTLGVAYMLKGNNCDALKEIEEKWQGLGLKLLA